MENWIFSFSLLFAVQNLYAQNWTQVNKVVASDREENANFGFDVAISGNYAIVGAIGEDKDANGGGINMASAGAAYIYEITNDGVWIQVQKLVASDREQGAVFGYSVSIAGNIAVVGAVNADKIGDIDGGAAYIFQRNGAGTWLEIQKIVALGESENFGFPVDIFGDHLIVGDYNDDAVGDDAGAAYIFERDIGGAWQQVKILISPEPTAGNFFGYSVAITDSFAIVGERQDDSAQGSAYVFKRDTGNWTLIQKLEASDKQAGDLFGAAIAISGSFAVITAADDNAQAGSAYIFKLENGVWSQFEKVIASDAVAGDQFGYYGGLGISGNYIIIGAYFNDEGSINNLGSAYIFKFNALNNSWEELQKLSWTDQSDNDNFGWSAAISGNYTIVGTYVENLDSNGGFPLNNAGAAYIFLAGPQAIIDTNITLEYCAGDEFDLPFTVDTTGGGFETGNTFTAELSNSTGDFSSPDMIGSLTGITGGTISCELPGDLPEGTGYLIRIVSSDPVSISDVSDNLTIHALPAATIDSSGSLTFCEGDNVILAANPNGFKYQWKKGSSAIFGETNQTYIPTTTGNYSVNVTNPATGCDSLSLSVVVTVNSLPTTIITALGNTTFCEGDSVKLKETSILNLTYVWIRDEIPITGATNKTYEAVLDGDYTVQVSDFNGCKQISNSIHVTTLDTPTISSIETVTPVFCSGGSAEIVPISDVSSFNWSRDNLIVTGATSETNVSSITVQLSHTTCVTQMVIFTITAVTTDNCESASRKDTVYVKPQPTVVASPVVNDPICDSASTMITLSSSCLADIDSFHWEFSSTGSLISSDSIDHAQVINVTLDNTSNTDQTGQFSITSNLDGCASDPILSSVVVHPTPVVYNLSVSPNYSLCSGSVFNFSFQDSVTGSTHKWYRDTASNSISGDGSGSLGTSTLFPLSLTSSDSVVAEITVTIVPDYFGCPGDPITESIFVKPTPVLSSSLNPTIYCSESAANILLHSNVNNGVFFLASLNSSLANVPGSVNQLGDNPVSVPFISLHNAGIDAAATSIIVQLDADGCPAASVDTLTLTLNPNPVFDPSIFDVKVCSGTPFSSTDLDDAVIQLDNKTTFEWSPTDSTGGVTGGHPGSDDAFVTGALFAPDNALHDTMFYDITPIFTNDSLQCFGSPAILRVNVNGLPDSSIFIKPNNFNHIDICSDYWGLYFAVTENPLVKYWWDASIDNIPFIVGTDQNNSHHNCVMFFHDDPLAGNETVDVFVTATLKSTGCYRPDVFTVQLTSPATIDTAHVILSDTTNGILACLNNDVDEYQWGFYDKATLDYDSTLLPASIYQVYIAGDTDALDLDHKYWWVITGKDNCESRSFYNLSDTAWHLTGIDNSPAAIQVPDVLLYPNPNDGAFMLRIHGFSSTDVTLSIADLTGRIYLNEKVSSHELQVGIPLKVSLDQGIYIIRAMDKAGKSVVTKFVIQ